MNALLQHIRRFGQPARLREATSASSMPQLERGGEPEELEERDSAGAAMPDGSYPIETADDVANAVDDYNRAGQPADVKAHITKRAKALGATGKLPADWTASTKTKEALQPERLHSLLREASVRKVSEDGKPPRYEVTLVREGMGNPKDRRVYTREALQSIVDKNLAEGLQAYANHPTVSEERDQPERDVRKLVGHYEQAKLVEADGSAAVRSVFVPITGEGYEWVVSLVESSLANDTPNPLVGISILGDGFGEEAKFTDGQPAVFIREIDSLDSADLVTKAGAGGTFHRRLQESLRGLDASRPGLVNDQEVTMKLREAQEKVKAATATLTELGKNPDADNVEQRLKEAFQTLNEVADATIDPEVREVEKPVAAGEGEADELAAKLRETETKLDTAEQRATSAEEKVAGYERAAAAAKVLREAEVSKDDANRWLPELVKVEPGDMKRIVESKLAEREAVLASVRESFVSGVPARAGAPVAAGGRDLLGDLHVDRELYADDDEDED